MSRASSIVSVLLLTFLKLTCDVFVIAVANNLQFYDTLTTQDIIAGDVFFEIVEPSDLQYTYRLRPAKDFGAPFNSNFKLIKTPLVPTVPSDACGKIHNAPDVKGNVALIERGECSFLAKTLNVEQIGAKAAIITESSGKASHFDYYIEMIHDNTSQEANIPAGFLLGKNGRIIRNTLKKLRRHYALINLPVNLTFTPPHRINHPPWLGW